MRARTAARHRAARSCLLHLQGHCFDRQRKSQLREGGLVLLRKVLVLRGDELGVSIGHFDAQLLACQLPHGALDALPASHTRIFSRNRRVLGWRASEKTTSLCESSITTPSSTNTTRSAARRA